VRARFSIADLGAHGTLVLLSLLSAFPVYWMIASSLRAPNDIFSNALIPAAPSLDNYAYVWSAIPMARMLVNTLVVALLTTLAQGLTAILAAYALTRWRFAGQGFIMAALALTWLVPFQVTMIPNYVLVSQLGWLDTLTALLVPHVASAFAVLLLFQSFNAFPKDLIDAARIDGASDAAILWRVVVPPNLSALATLGILLFIGAWNDYLWPLLVTRHAENGVVQIGLQMFLTQEGNQWGPLMAAATLASLPVLLLYAVLQRQVIDSFMKSGLR
jgi:ABC-type glycerol-3-phosphate transport system permease component